MHRDVSAGNLIEYTDPQTKESRGILIDLEYAKEFRVSDDPRQQPRTVCALSLILPITCCLTILADQGTNLFMGIEVADQTFRFWPEEGAFPTVWRHNTLHDFESIWWIALWVAFTFRGEEVIPSKKDVELCDQFFDGNPLLASRIDLLEKRNRLETCLGAVTYNRELFVVLIGLGNQIRAAQRKSQNGREEDWAKRLDDVVIKIAGDMETSMQLLIESSSPGRQIIQQYPKAPVEPVPVAPKPDIDVVRDDLAWLFPEDDDHAGTKNGGDEGVDKHSSGDEAGLVQTQAILALLQSWTVAKKTVKAKQTRRARRS